MCTGYAIAGVVFMIRLTSYSRHRIPYEIFYAVHHLLLILCIVTVAHTFDRMQRNSTCTRSQTFHWVSATLLYYLCDRAASYLNHHYKAKLESSSAIDGSPEDAAPYSLRLRAWPVRFCPSLFHRFFLASFLHRVRTILSNFILKYSTSSPGLESCGT
jgi:hypothetical protein